MIKTSGFVSIDIPFVLTWSLFLIPLADGMKPPALLRSPQPVDVTPG